MTQVARSERGGVDFPEALQSLHVAPKPGEGECRVRVRACACLCVCLEAEGLRGTTRMRGLLRFWFGGYLERELGESFSPPQFTVRQSEVSDEDLFVCA